LVSAVGRLTPLLILGFALMAISPTVGAIARGRSPPLGAGLASGE
jgi:hypothetical protein